MLKSLLPYVLIVIFVFLIKAYIFSTVQVIGSSMEPLLKENDVLFLNKIAYEFEEIERFDIVVVEYESKLIIKRVIGLPGEEIYYEDNVLYIDGEKMEEEFEHSYTNDFDLIELEGYFVLGDNREVSKDSRQDGEFESEDILGKVNFIFYPFDKFGFLK